MLTRNVTSVKEIPGEPGQTMTFRQLSWRQLAEAEEARSATKLRALKAYPPEMLRDLGNVDRIAAQQAAAKELAAAGPQAVDPLDKFEQAYILYGGIVAWSYPDKVIPENIDSLDAATAKWAALEIINLGAPPIDKDVENAFFGSQGGSMATPATQTVALGATLTSQPNGSSA